MMLRTKYVQGWDGIPITPNMNRFKIRCCDCGLVHRMRIRRTTKGVQLTFWRDNRRTSATRRGKQYSGLRLSKIVKDRNREDALAARKA